jgi:4-amino-4-deoxy-L-arabinose transferase-like glycosyltransferase
VSTEEARATWALVLACALVLLPRLVVFPWSENLYGDAATRTELAQRWLAAPHWISHMDDGAYQFGPLHLYLVAGALALGVDREDAGRWVSLLFGVLTVLPLWSLSRRLAGMAGAWWAVAGLALWGMHIRMSTTALPSSFRSPATSRLSVAAVRAGDNKLKLHDGAVGNDNKSKLHDGNCHNNRGSPASWN